ncbi:uncharacterized protein [Cicer arietinum]|uniref:Uncharacterized protein LOC101506800 n=1 Tax=Cicer arietinum TaxID=3827 RepID=A0A1S2YTL8_CICAR|nr:uncharacterized protein LOC101506800 [Cicer arietinum]
MSLNCLTCGQALQRENSERENLPEIIEVKTCTRKVRIQIDRSWSGNLSPPQCESSGGAVDKIKTEHRRTQSEGNVGPRLLRSSGMRRDWCLEDLIGQQDKIGVRCY